MAVPFCFCIIPARWLRFLLPINRGVTHFLRVFKHVVTRLWQFRRNCVRVVVIVLHTHARTHTFCSQKDVSKEIFLYQLLTWKQRAFHMKVLEHIYISIFTDGTFQLESTSEIGKTQPRSLSVTPFQQSEKSYQIIWFWETFREYWQVSDKHPFRFTSEKVINSKYYFLWEASRSICESR